MSQDRSPLGKSLKDMHAWAKWYLEVRELDVPLEQFLELAGRQPGTKPGLTKTKMRKAAALLSKMAESAPAPSRKAS